MGRFRSVISSRAGTLAACLSLGTLASPASAALAQDDTTTTQPDWSQAALDDLSFIRAIIADNHPGPVDPETPAFRDWYERGFEVARSLAVEAENPAGYYFALMRYVIGFNDGHLGLLPDASLNVSWSSPGFVLKRSGDEYVVATVQRPEVSPPTGAVLISCDDRPAGDLARERVGEFLSPWEPAARRYAMAPWVLLDGGNPFVARPESCIFTEAGSRDRYLLDWKPVGNVGGLVAEATESGMLDNEMRRVRGGYWLSLPRLLMSGQHAQTEVLEEIIDRVARERDSLLDATFVVFDLRSNTGGSSTWVRRIADLLWGEDYLDALQLGSTAIDHRVSRGNYEHFRWIRDTHFTDPDRPGYEYVHALVEGLEAGLARGDTFFRYANDDDSDESHRTAAPPPARATDLDVPVFVLTDHTCASACLDAVDLLLAAGATQIGRATSGDTPYMEARTEALPSGYGELVFPTKVYRGRPRGSNEAYAPKPEHIWEGPMNDVPALEAWVSELARARA